MTEIVLENITKSFRGKTVLENISLKIRSEDITVFLGPAGAGKTTLFRIIAGTEKPDKGKVYFDSQDVTLMPPQKRNVSMVFQSFALYPNMTVFENIASPMRVKNMPEQEIRKQVEEVAEFLGIKQILQKKPHEISGGEAQRTAIARALVKKPKVFLFDEPLTNLDYKVREILRAELQRIFHEVKATVLYSTSNPEEAAALGKTLVHLRGGKIVQTGAVKECFRHPVDLTAASSYSPIGVNILPAKCEKGPAGKFLRVGTDISLDVSSYDALKDGEEYLLAAYPHDVKLFALNSPKSLSIPIEIDFIENMGSEIVVVARSGQQVINIILSEVEKLHEIKNKKRCTVDLTDLMIFSKEGLYIQNLRG
ncbi:MAG: ABC transporter ATP-binding protein [Candidatus Caldarchaeum sp.]|nr:ABC transporter ATP-binding protein [Candidatus Caldarchaeum sp.]